MDSAGKKIAYILYNERPSSGLVKEQVIALLKEVKNKSNFDVTLICVWQPWVQFVYREQIREIVGDLSKKGVKVENYPIAIVPNRHFLHSHITLPSVMKLLYMMFFTLRLSRFDLVHSRSYVPSYIVAKHKNKNNYKCIFDMRSLFPEEYVTVGKWELGSAVYKLWKRYEKYTVEKSDSFITVSKEMGAQADKISNDKKSKLIPLMANIDRLKYDGEARANIREKYKLKDKFVVAYTGSLGFTWLWNNIENYARYYKRMNKLYDNLFFIFVIPEILDGFDDVLNKHGIKNDQYLFVEGDSEISSWLSAADAGIHVMSIGPDSPTRFGVKVVEYISNGLPVISNSGVGAASDFIEYNNFGIRLDLDEEFDEKFSLFLNKNFTREDISKLSEGMFSVESVSKKYIDLYCQLLP